MTRVVLQRMHEIGVLKASGISDRDIFLVFAFEAVLYGLVGGVLGCLLGLSISVFGPMPDADEALRAALITVCRLDPGRRRGRNRPGPQSDPRPRGGGALPLVVTPTHNKRKERSR